MGTRIEFGKYQNELEKTIAVLEKHDVVQRIWGKDHHVWKPDPKEISNRLGWLTITDSMLQHVTELETFSKQALDDGLRYVVLLGMGGSSLGAEVTRQVFQRGEGSPELIVLDSIDPDWIKQVMDRIDPTTTLFLVSSKSGTTIEPLLLFEHFKSHVESVTGKGNAGKHFIAITDPGTPLVKLAKEEGFRHVFENPSDIGGRFSVLSYFGLVPAVLAGVNIKELLRKAGQMKNDCAGDVSIRDNPGSMLGAIMGSMAMVGRDKLTLITSPEVNQFGLWVEQLVAESTGKEGKGIIPIAGEPLVDTRCYGEDRLFVFLRLEGDDNTVLDEALEKIKGAGQPLVLLEMGDRYDIGAEFFRWEFAITVAGALLRINPFDQPDVQKAKNATSRLLEVYETTGKFPVVESKQSLTEMLADAAGGKYLSIMAYVVESSETERLIHEFRRKVMEKYSIATTFGYGPRFLHSTGQLHKGGPPTGMFLQLTVDHSVDIPVPGKPYTFGMLTNAQAMGDLQALQSSGRNVINMHITSGDETVAAGLMDRLE